MYHFMYFVTQDYFSTSYKFSVLPYFVNMAEVLLLKEQAIPSIQGPWLKVYSKAKLQE